MVTAIVVAAGKSERMGAGTDKAFLSLGQKPVLAWSLLAFERSPEVDNVVLVVRKDQLAAAKAVAKMFGISKLQKVVPGGARRQDSVQNGLKEVDSDTRVVLVHDGARPCATPELVGEIVKLVKRHGAVVAGRRIYDTVKVVGKSQQVESTADRSKLWAVQTPQGFNVRLLQRAYAEVEKRKLEVTDDAQAVEILGEPVRIHEWPAVNVKITTPGDLQVAAAALKL